MSDTHVSRGHTLAECPCSGGDCGMLHDEEPAACRVCGCTEDDPCPTGNISAYSCLPVTDPQGSPRLCSFHGDEAAVRCDVVSIGIFTLGERQRCSMAATHQARFDCERGHRRDLKVCRLHVADDGDIPSDCAACDDEGMREVPVHLVESTPIYPHLQGEVPASRAAGTSGYVGPSDANVELGLDGCQNCGTSPEAHGYPRGGYDPFALAMPCPVPGAGTSGGER